MQPLPERPSAFVSATSILAGLAAFVGCYRTIRPTFIHGFQQNVGAAAITGGIGFFLFLSGLFLLMPNLRRWVLARANNTFVLAALIAWAGILSLAYFVMMVVVLHDVVPAWPGNAVALAALAIGGAPLYYFIRCYVAPGVAYRPYSVASPAPVTPAVPAPAPLKPVPIRNPYLRSAVKVYGYILATLWGGGFLALMFLSVVPDTDLLVADRKYLPLSALVLTLPVIALLVRAWVLVEGSRRLKEVGKAVAVLAFLIVMNGFSIMQAVEQAFPYVWNLTHDAPDSVRSYPVVRTSFHTRYCGSSVEVRLADPDGLVTTLCHLNWNMVGKARPGDRILVGGRDSRFGMTYDRVIVIPQAK